MQISHGDKNERNDSDFDLEGVSNGPDAESDFSLGKEGNASDDSDFVAVQRKGKKGRPRKSADSAGAEKSAASLSGPGNQGIRRV